MTRKQDTPRMPNALRWLAVGFVAAYGLAAQTGAMAQTPGGMQRGPLFAGQRGAWAPPAARGGSVAAPALRGGAQTDASASPAQSVGNGPAGFAGAPGQRPRNVYSFVVR